MYSRSENDVSPKQTPGKNGAHPLVSVVIATWNRRDDVLEAVASVYKQTYAKFEIIVVDNASTDGTTDALAQEFPEVRVVALGENVGAAAGRNRGIAQASGEIIFLLDSDAVVDNQAITGIVATFEADPTLGAIACKVVNAHTRQLDRTAGWFFSEKIKQHQDESFLSYSFSECGCAIRSEALKEAGLFWEHLFIDGEGEELAVRIWEAGYQILYWPKALVYHRVSPNKRFSFRDRVYYKLRNSLFIYVAHYPWPMLLLFGPTRVGVSLIMCLRRRCIRNVLQALVDSARQLPAIWSQRRPMGRQTARIYFRLVREHGPLSWDLATWFKYRA